jgi:murein DD-endopeptidase MepM/ murein hydrolase activator NlpD
MSDQPRLSPMAPLNPTLFSQPAPRVSNAAAGGDEFQTLLNTLQASTTQNLMANLPMPGAGNVPADTASTNWGGDLFSIEPMLTLTVMQLLEKLMEKLGPTGGAPTAVPHGLPANGPISQGYHDGHHALDIAVPEGTPIKATMDGRVVFSGWSEEGYGNLVILENGPYRAYYAHLSQLPLAVGDSVTAGAVIGYSGNTGHSTGPHLHYEVRLNGAPLPPDTSG